MEIDIIKSPVEYFRYYFDETLLDQIVFQSNLYSIQQNSNKPLRLTQWELEQCIGVVLYIACATLPNSRLYSSKVYRNDNIANVMSWDRWEEIKRNLHFNDNSQQPSSEASNIDRMFKIGPLIDHLQSKVRRVPSCEFLSVDEQIMPYKGNHNSKQYIPLFPLNAKKVRICEIMSGGFAVKIQQCVKKSGYFW